jgi:SH3-like domain-containing protein
MTPWRLTTILVLTATPALAQTSGVLQAPSGKPEIYVAPTPPKAAPVTPVQRAAPSVPGHSASAASPTADGHTRKPHEKPAVKPAPGTAPAVAPPPNSGSAAAAAAHAAAAKPANSAPATAEKKPDPNKGTSTGQPLPRWASLRSDDVNLRTGPGMRYPVEWAYHRRDLPIQITREYDVWRLIEDQDGVKGWVHHANLNARRGFVVVGEERTLRSAAEDHAEPVARLKPGVVGRIRRCDGGGWCEVQVGEYRGWLKSNELWGISPGETIAP